MNLEIQIYKLLLSTLLITAPIIFISLLLFSAPYGRYSQKKWGLAIPAPLGWVLMEIPAVLTMAMICLYQPLSLPAPDYANALFIYFFLMLWLIHYVHRTFVYPLRLKNFTRNMPVIIVISGALFNLINGYINGISLTLIHHYDFDWLYDPRFILGVILFFTGFIINQHSDSILLKLRSENSNEYKIPQGGLFRWISCPNYLGEIVEWSGWALATWSLAGLAFALWTTANLLPRALAHHAWYQRTFEDYPKERRALI